jgi:hypothetical protein
MIELFIVILNKKLSSIRIPSNLTNEELINLIYMYRKFLVKMCLPQKYFSIVKNTFKTNKILYEVRFSYNEKESVGYYNVGKNFVSNNEYEKYGFQFLETWKKN